VAGSSAGFLHQINPGLLSIFSPSFQSGKRRMDPIQEKKELHWLLQRSLFLTTNLSDSPSKVILKLLFNKKREKKIPGMGST